MPCTRVCSDSRVLAVEKRKLNLTCASPGIPLLAPGPALKFEICQVVGGKYSLPLSHWVCASSAIAAATAWIGFFARCGWGAGPSPPLAAAMADGEPGRG